jgi:hypothetical protein
VLLLKRAAKEHKAAATHIYQMSGPAPGNHPMCCPAAAPWLSRGCKHTGLHSRSHLHQHLCTQQRSMLSTYVLCTLLLTVNNTHLFMMENCCCLGE